MVDSIDFSAFEENLSASDVDDELILEDDDQEVLPSDRHADNPWKILIVDDEPAIHQITELALEDFTFQERPVAFLSAYSGEEAKRLIEAQPDIALILLDVVMEAKDSGLQVVKYVRDVLGNKLPRIILRTGQPGEAPEESVILNYDIHDYKTKTEMTRHKFLTTIITALRSYQDIMTIEANRRELEALYADLAERAADLRIANEKLQQEIAERERVELELRKSEERYALAARGANDGLWDWNLQSDELYLSPRWKAMLGYQEDEIEHTPSEWFKRVHPNDLEQLRHKIDLHLRNATTHFEHEYRLLHKDGSYRWMLCRGLAIRDAHGQAQRMAGSQTDISTRKKAEAQLLHDAFHSTLTGLPNRALFLDRLTQSLDFANRRQNYLCGVLFINLDRFKIVNDHFGHTRGNQVLMTVAQRLRTCVRAGDTVAHLGGDEFAVLLDDIADDNEAIRLTGQIRNVLAKPIYLNTKEIIVTASVGIALGRDPISGRPHERAEYLLQDANLAMYRAKQSGQDGYEMFDISMRIRSIRRLELETGLRQAIEQQQFEVHYQPIVSLDNDQISGVEALLRWQHPERGLVYPDEFITLLEETGLIVATSEWLLRTTCAQIKTWQAAGYGPLRVAVNISVRQLHEQNMAKVVQKILEETGLTPEALELEVTEHIAMQNVSFGLTTLNELSALGVHISIDDFGMGYSSLDRLRSLPVNTLKIDQSFVRDIRAEADDAPIIGAIVAMAHNLKLKVIAEGVETPEQLALLRSLQCDEIQGHLISQPLPTAAITKLLQKGIKLPPCGRTSS